MSECRCGRRRATAAEHDQALEEFRRCGDDPFGTLYMRPLWMTALCFAAVRGIECRLKRRWASERYIDEARGAFAAYLLKAGLVDEAGWFDMRLRPDAE